MAIRIEDLPEHVARRVRAELEKGEKMRMPDDRSGKPGGKYGAVKEDRGRLRFDSRKEARRYDALVVLLKSGEITDLKIQPEFTLVEAYTTPGGRAGACNAVPGRLFVQAGRKAGCGGR